MRDVLEPVESVRERVDRPGDLDLWVRRGMVTLLAAVVVVALCNVVGQRASTATTSAPLAAITVHSPTAVRPGLLFQARITITPRADIPDAAIVLSSGWFDGITANTEEPAAASETSGPGGSVVFHLGALTAATPYVEYLEFQVNATSLSSRHQTITLTSHGATVATLTRTVRIYP